MLANCIVERKGQRWLIREAVSITAAESAITAARVSGSVGHRIICEETAIGGSRVVLADVVQVNSDGTERKPYIQAY